MAQSIEDITKAIVEELAVLEDDIDVTSDSITFYLPPEDLDEAKEKLDADLKVLEEYEYEYLIKATCS
jgi:hypothetical protein